MASALRSRQAPTDSPRRASRVKPATRGTESSRAGRGRSAAPAGVVTRLSPATLNSGTLGSASELHSGAWQASSERQELLCSVIGLAVKLGIGFLASVSLVHLAGAYQQRLDSHGEISAIVDIEKNKLRKVQERFDRLFSKDGEQRLIREQDQWIAPNRLRVVWEDSQLQNSPAAQLTPAPKPSPAGG